MNRSRKRKSSRRKSVKRKSSRRKSRKRKSVKRKSRKRKSVKRKSSRRSGSRRSSSPLASRYTYRIPTPIYSPQEEKINYNRPISSNVNMGFGSRRIGRRISRNSPMRKIVFKNTPYGRVRLSPSKTGLSKTINARLARNKKGQIYFKAGKNKYISSTTKPRVFKMGFSDSYTVYTKDGCPHCKSAVEYLQEKGYHVNVKRGEENRSEIDSKLKTAGRTDFRTWPKVFAPDGSFIGGNQDLRNKL